MELKKSPKADLEGKRTYFLEIGLILALLFVWAAFEWSANPEQVQEDQFAMDDELEEEILVTRPPETPPPPPPPPPPPAPTDEIEVVKDDVEIETEIEVNVEAEEEETVVVTEIVEAEEVIDEQQVFVVVEEMPEFPGGMNALNKFLGKNIKYPQIAADNGIQGRVFIKFVVEKDGSVGETVVARGVDKSLDNEAQRVIKKMPKWKPGKQRGKAVRVWYTVPVNFRLQ